jgi:hypothetical protein
MSTRYRLRLLSSSPADSSIMPYEALEWSSFTYNLHLLNTNRQVKGGVRNSGLPLSHLHSTGR